MTENESIYDAAIVSDEAPESEPDFDEPTSEWQPMISKESPKDKLDRLGVKKEVDGEILTIRSYFFTRPRTKNNDGTAIEAKKTIDGTKSYYPGKLGLRFEEENLIEYYPNFHYFVNNDGQVNNFAKINREGNNSVSKIFKLVLAKLDKEADIVSDQEVFDFLIGKKVKIKVDKGNYLGRSWFRNDIVEILD